MPTRCSMPLENLRSCTRRSRADAHLVEQRADAAPAVGRADAEQAAEVGQQLFGREVIVEVRVLRQVTEAALRGEVARRTPEDARLAGRRKHQLQQQLQRRRLAGAVRTEKPEDLAGFHLQREAVEDAPRPLPPEANGVVLGELDGFDRGCQSSRGRPGPWVRRRADHSSRTYRSFGRPL